MTKSESIQSIAAALVRAQGKFPPIIRTKTATITGEKGSYSFNYAPLEEILHTIRPTLQAEGLALMQGVEGFNLVTTLLHTSGEWISHAMEMPKAYTSSRAYGSELSFRRRYSVTSVLGIASEEDDDGQHAERELEAARRRQTAKASATGFNRECFEDLPPKHQDHLRELAANITALLDEERNTDAYLYIEEQKLDDQEKPALWWLLDSKQRSAIKKASDEYHKTKGISRKERQAA